MDSNCVPGSGPIDKYWEDLTADEKIERLAKTIENQRETITELWQANNVLMNHVHNTEGHVMARAGTMLGMPRSHTSWLLNRKS